MEGIPSGFVFQPSDKEIIAYLSSKVKGEILNCDSYIHEMNLYGEGENKNPWKIFEEVRKTRIGSDDDDDDDHDEAILYFFTTLSKKYKNKKRIRRTAGGGTWTQEVGRPIYGDDGETMIGMMKTLSFTYNKSGAKRKKNTKSGSWIMHEYSLPATGAKDDNQTDETVLCRIRRKGVARSDSSSSVHHEIPAPPPLETLLPTPTPTLLNNSFSNPSGPNFPYLPTTMVANPLPTMFNLFSSQPAPMNAQFSYNFKPTTMMVDPAYQIWTSSVPYLSSNRDVSTSTPSTFVAPVEGDILRWLEH